MGTIVSKSAILGLMTTQLSAQAVDAASNVLQSVLQEDLVSVVLFGSAVTGDFFPGISDLDILVTTATGLTVADCVRLQRAAEVVDMQPFRSIQAIYFRATDPTPSLVPGGFEVLTGPSLPDGFVKTELDLRESGQHWLQGHHERYEKDLYDWSMAGGEKLPRIGRLLVTRVKPTIRALLAQQELSAVPIWLATWDELAIAAQNLDEHLKRCIGKLTVAMGADPVDWGIVGRRSIYVLECVSRLL